MSYPHIIIRACTDSRVTTSLWGIQYVAVPSLLEVDAFASIPDIGRHEELGEDDGEGSAITKSSRRVFDTINRRPSAYTHVVSQRRPPQVGSRIAWCAEWLSTRADLRCRVSTHSTFDLLLNA